MISFNLVQTSETLITLCIIFVIDTVVYVVIDINAVFINTLFVNIKKKTADDHDQLLR